MVCALSPGPVSLLLAKWSRVTWLPGPQLEGYDCGGPAVLRAVRSGILLWRPRRPGVTLR